MSKRQHGLVMDEKWGRRITAFVVLFLLYLIWQFILVLGKKEISSYQVRAGELAENRVFRAVLQREEEVITSEQTGYIAYFAREGEHVGVGDLLYAIDETGSLNDLLNRSDGETSMDEADLSELRSQIIDFAGGFTPIEFQSCYDFTYRLNGSLLKLANSNVLSSLADISSAHSADLVRLNYSAEPGYVVYHTDGLESVSENSIDNLMDEEAHQKEQLLSNSLVAAGDPVYKLITSEDWSILIGVDPERAASMEADGYVQVKFLKNRQILWGQVTELIPYDEELVYVRLAFNNSMLNFCTDRYLDVELVESNSEGLKIPTSSIVHKEFFLVPKDYLLMDGGENTLIFLRKTFLADGTASSEEMKLEVYAEDDDYYYVDDTQLRIGDYLIKPESMAEFAVSQKGELVGVYNINKGYADFRRVVILYQNDDYAIVKSNTAYGLNEYDYIALDAASLKDDEFVFE